MSLHFYVEEHREKLMRHPEHYIESLRRMNELHSVWHGELQERIDRLEACMREVVEVMEGYQEPEIASTAKLHRYARTLREALDARND